MSTVYATNVKQIYFSFEIQLLSSQQSYCTFCTLGPVSHTWSECSKWNKGEAITTRMSMRQENECKTGQYHWKK